MIDHIDYQLSVLYIKMFMLMTGMHYEHFRDCQFTFLEKNYTERTSAIDTCWHCFDNISQPLANSWLNRNLLSSPKHLCKVDSIALHGQFLLICQHYFTCTDIYSSHMFLLFTAEINAMSSPHGAQNKQLCRLRNKSR